MDCHTLLPHHFRCPISLELMTDPVILSTGITYDRTSIEKWLCSGRNTCPATNQVLESKDLVPNVVLRRLIRDWCLNNNCPISPSDTVQNAPPQLVSDLLRKVDDGYCVVESLKSLRSLALENKGNRDAIASIRGLRILSYLLSRLNSDTKNWNDGDADVFREVVGILSLLPLNDETKFTLTHSSALLRSARFLDGDDTQLKINFLRLLGNLTGEERFLVRVCALERLIERLHDILIQDADPILIETTLVTLRALCTDTRFKTTALTSGIISRLETLFQRGERTLCETSLEFLHYLLSSKECCQAAAKDGTSLVPALTIAILKYSEATTDYAVRILRGLCTEKSCCQRAVENGAVAKALLLLQADCSSDTKRNALELLHLLSKECKQVPYVYWPGTTKFAFNSGEETDNLTNR